MHAPGIYAPTNRYSDDRPIKFFKLRRNCVSPAPVAEVDYANHDAERVGRNESQLAGLGSDDAHDDAINTCHYPAFPAAPTDQDGGGDGEHTRQIIEP